jgi:hypothetical protein
MAFDGAALYETNALTGTPGSTHVCPRACARARRAGIPVLACLLTLGGCFSYRPVDLAAVRPEEQIRVVVNETATARLVNEFQLLQPFEGQLAPLSPDTLGFKVWIGRDYVGTPFGNARQTIPIVRTDIVEVQRKRFSVKRTTLFTIAMVGMITVAVDKLGLVELPWNEPGEQPLPPEGEPFVIRRR